MKGKREKLFSRNTSPTFKRDCLVIENSWILLKAFERWFIKLQIKKRRTAKQQEAQQQQHLPHRGNNVNDHRSRFSLCLVIGNGDMHVLLQHLHIFASLLFFNRSGINVLINFCVFLFLMCFQGKWGAWGCDRRECHRIFIDFVVN